MSDDATFRRDDGLLQWERRQDENCMAYDAFSKYLALGPGRTVEAAWKATIPRRAAGRCWWQWSLAYDWIARATAYDTYLGAS